MKIGIIGAGGMAATLTRHLAKLGHDVSMANARGPESLAALAGEIAMRLTDIAKGPIAVATRSLRVSAS